MDKTRTKKLFQIIAGGIAAVVILFFIMRNGDEESTSVTWPTDGRPVKLLTVEPGDGALMREFPGIAMPVREVQLAFRVDGPLRDLPVDVGQFVKKGELIAQLDPRDFKVRVATLKAQQASFEAQLVNARLRYTRYQNLYTTDATPKASLDAAKAAHDQLAAQVAATTAQLDDARNSLTDTRLLAPFDGYVDRKFVENYDNVKAKETIISFLDCSIIEVTAGVPEELVAEGMLMQKFFCEFDSYPGKSFPAELKELGRKPGSANQAYPLTVKLPAPESVLVKPGMAATLSIMIESAAGSAKFVVPPSAVINDKDNRSFVWRYDSEAGIVEPLFITAGQLVSGGIEVLDGLAGGEQIVTAGAHFLRSGQKANTVTENWRQRQDRSAESSKP